jgi:carbamoyl-phosphate synthase small subunit
MNSPQPIMRLILEDGTEFHGRSFGAAHPASGEVVFNTAMTGYPESLTDASYQGQILVSTYPLIGNYGVPDDIPENGLPRFFESDRIRISGLVIADYSPEYSHWSAGRSLGQWLAEHDIPGIFGVDTRRLTKILRERGTMLGKIISAGDNLPYYDPNEHNLVAQVSTPERIVYGQGKYRILLIDCGVKYNILRCLLERDTTVIRVPWDHDPAGEEFDGLFITNGPGDPCRCEATIRHLRECLGQDRPIFGICLGSQLMALAAGAGTFKLKYGHRGHNQPVIQAGTNRCYITSQNHGFAVDDKTLPDGWELLFRNLNDDTCEGIRHVSRPFFSTQFHPEASGGPTDTGFLFDVFLDMIRTGRPVDF